MNKILLTGASGFLGEVVFTNLSTEYRITTCGRSKENDIICDLSTSLPALNKYEYVIHAAGKAHTLPKTELEELEFKEVNYQGTVNLTKALEKTTLPQAFIFISSVAVYGVDKGLGIDENCHLLGNSPYAKSKINAENFLIEWGKKNSINITILRLPLIAGCNPPGNLGAIIKAIKKGYYFRLGNGQARKSMVWASDLTKILPTCFKTSGVFNLTDNVDPSIKELDVAIGENFSKKIRIFPLWLVGMLALPSMVFSFWPINKSRIEKLTTSLTFSSKKATSELGWQPRSVIDCINEYGI